MTSNIRKDMTFQELLAVVDKQREQKNYFEMLLDQWDHVDCSHSYDEVAEMLEEITEIFAENVELAAGIITRQIFASCGLQVVD